MTGLMTGLMHGALRMARSPAWLAVLVFAAVAALAGAAEAYPQFQLSRDRTCTGCHISPAGGNLLNENGESTSETIAMIDHPGAFLYGALPLPSWLTLGGDLRGSTGYIQTPEKVLATFPMQIEAYANVRLPVGFSIQVHGGTRPPTMENAATPGKNFLWSREHYLMWRTSPGTPTGLFVRAGRFMPVFGLRYAEHPMYTRRFGGTPLWGETYGGAVELVMESIEVHATGFIEDPLIEPVRHAKGGALYAELRVTDSFSIGGGGMLEIGEDDQKRRGTVTVKKYLSGPDLLFQAEVQVMNQRIDPIGAPVQLIGNLVMSRNLSGGFLLDVGIGHFDTNIRIRDLDRDALDVNLHWFTTSHIELIFNGRFEMLAFGKGGDSHAYALLQAHYRL
ncbi:MAG TPA: hypothetical protein VNO30_50540 [Kofleriaceae bacterium]|nr:hypothetical protein [Kofleriaceae bacterium]